MAICETRPALACPAITSLAPRLDVKGASQLAGRLMLVMCRWRQKRIPKWRRKRSHFDESFLYLFRRCEMASRPSLPGRYTSLDSISQAGIGTRLGGQSGSLFGRHFGLLFRRHRQAILFLDFGRSWSNNSDYNKPKPIRAARRSAAACYAVFGAGISKSRQILMTRKSLISRCRGTDDAFPLARFT